jgi:glycosyltransferase involved in cell wall biosynthesis
MKRILFLVQLPPPVHGAAIMNEIVVNSKLIGEYFENRHVDISVSHKIEDIGRFSPSKLLGVARTLAAIIRELLVFRPHIVYLTLAPSGFAFYRDVLYVYFIRLFRPELVLHLHGKGLRQGAEKSRLFRWLGKSIFKSSHVIFLSEGLRSDAACFRIKSSFVVNNGFPDGPVPPRVAQDDKEEIEILYLSNYVRSKGVLDLVDALGIVACTHTRFRVNLVGRPVDISRDALEKYVFEKGLAEKVRVCGPRYNGEKVGMLESADIFVLPTYYDNEAFPLSILEAMKFGLPVISTFEGGIPDIIDTGRDGLLFPKRDVAALAREIVYLLDHPEERRSLGDAARTKFSAKFTVSIFERNLLQVFQRISAPVPSYQ